MGKKTRLFAWSPLRKLMKRQGAQIVSRDAVDKIIDHLAGVAMQLTKVAYTFAMHAKRKKITKDDMLLAIKYTSLTNIYAVGTKK